MLIGKKVRLRRIEKADLWKLWQWHEERGLYLFNELKQFISCDEVNQDFLKYFGWKGDFLVEDKRWKALGVCSYKNISWKNRSCKLAIQLYESEQTFAIDAITILLEFLFEELNLSRVYSFVPAFFLFENQAFEKAGFIPEGKLREAIFWDGKYHDISTYAILKEEFEKEKL
jgi:RimJ/RimL family protein N-acetyltransferase